MKHFLITSQAGKRLIGKALASNTAVVNAAKSNTLVIIAGTTNGYIAEELLKHLNIDGFSRKRFFRGLTLPYNMQLSSEGRLIDESQFPGDIIITKGEWQKGKTINDIVDTLEEGDLIIKGANAINLEHNQAAVLIGHPKAGTIGIILPAVVGRRVKLIVAVGLEKRVNDNLYALAEKTNAPGNTGYRLLPIPGQVFTELDAITQLTGATADLIASGGICGAEGAVYLVVHGSKEQEEIVEKLFNQILVEPSFDPNHI
ncbi:MAG: hypothetical protein LBE70_01180 [Nitrososphaerota archaeon]|jgi:hypothetical protein|nr:hypothetical protein [Nitrososphaerota archaeon]